MKFNDIALEERQTLWADLQDLEQEKELVQASFENYDDTSRERFNAMVTSVGFEDLVLDADAPVEIAMESLHSFWERVKRRAGKFYKNVLTPSTSMVAPVDIKTILHRIVTLKSKAQEVKGTPHSKVTDKRLLQRLCIDGRVNYDVVKKAQTLGDEFHGLVKGRYVDNGVVARKMLTDFSHHIRSEAIKGKVDNAALLSQAAAMIKKLPLPEDAVPGNLIHAKLIAEVRVFNEEAPNVAGSGVFTLALMERLKNYHGTKRGLVHPLDNRLSQKDIRPLTPAEMVALCDAVEHLITTKITDLNKHNDATIKAINADGSGYAQLINTYQGLGKNIKDLSNQAIDAILYMDTLHRTIADDMINPNSILRAVISHGARTMLDYVQDSLFCYSE